MRMTSQDQTCQPFFAVAFRFPFRGIVVCCLSVLALLPSAIGLTQAVSRPPEGDIPHAQAVLGNYLDKRLQAAEAQFQREKARAEGLQRRIGQERAQAHALDQQISTQERELAAIPKPDRRKDNPKPSEELANRLKVAEDTFREQTTRTKDLQDKIEQERALDQKLKEAQAQTDAAEKQLLSPEAKEKMEVLDRIAAAQAALKEVESELEKLRAQVNEAKKPQADASATGAGTVIPWPPAGQVQPIFIECHTKGLTIYKIGDANKVEKSEIALEMIGSSQELSSASAQTAAEAKTRVVNFLVRPGGVKAFDKALHVVKNKKAPWSSVPIPLDLKLQFQPPEAAKPSE